ncbi:MAG TPA: DUF2061 domain-containing protein [archaeon]|nr:DUF2061 domain-containing protein [archaeon]
MFDNAAQQIQAPVSGPKWIAAQKNSISEKAAGTKNAALNKTLRFRAVTLVTTLGLTWLVTGNPVASIGLTVLQQSTNTAVYYFFEKNYKKRAW